MSQSVTKVAIFGSTGSIGCSTLEVIEASGGALAAYAITAHTRVEEALRQAGRHRVRWLALTDPDAAARCTREKLPPPTQWANGQHAVEQIARDPAVDVVVAAIVGSAGLQSTWAALDAGKRVALANKETLVMAGPLVMQLAAKRNASIIPVDSEHSAIFQAIGAGRKEQVRRILLTASGGPFLRHSVQQLENVTVSDALDHPTWNMGRKISVDSATMMNKALEIVEARWLFDLAPEQIDVVIHPQSIVHSLVEFHDGSVIAQMSPPDMRLPIQYALTYPNRVEGIARCVDWSQSMQLDFEPPDFERFPALQLGHQVAKAGGTAGVVVNAANEAAVEAFLNQQLPFTEIVRACRSVLEHHCFDPSPSLQDLIRLDQWARQEVFRWICT